MKTKNFKIKNDLCDFYSPVKIAAAEAAAVVAVTTAETSCMLLQIERLREMIQRTILAQHQYKLVDILSANDINISIQYLEKIYRNLDGIEAGLHSASGKTVLESKYEIKLVMSELSSIFRNYGTHSISDLLEVTVGSEYVKSACESLCSSAGTVFGLTSSGEWDHKKYEVLNTYFHPINNFGYLNSIKSNNQQFDYVNHQQQYLPNFYIQSLMQYLTLF